MRGSRLLGLVFYSGKLGFFLQAGRRALWPKMKDNVETGFLKHGAHYTGVCTCNLEVRVPVEMGEAVSLEQTVILQIYFQ